MRTITLIELDRLIPDNPRPNDDLSKLADSISYVGLKEPLTVTPDGDSYKILAGSRRYRAIKALFDRDDPVWDEERKDFSLGRTLFRQVPCEVIE